MALCILCGSHRQIEPLPTDRVGHAVPIGFQLMAMGRAADCSGGPCGVRLAAIATAFVELIEALSDLPTLERSMSKLFLYALCFLLPVTAHADDLCVAPKQADINVKETPIPLCLVAKKIALTLDEYNSDPKTIKDVLPQLSKAEFDFKTVSSNSEGFKFSILVFSIGGSHKTESTNDVTFAYAVPPPEAKPHGFSIDAYVKFLGRKPKPKDFSAELIDTLQQAAEQIKLTSSVGAAKFKTLTVSLAYGVTWDFNGSVTLPISLVTAGGTLDHIHADTQTVKLTFENPVPAGAIAKKP